MHAILLKNTLEARQPVRHVVTESRVAPLVCIDEPWDLIEQALYFLEVHQSQHAGLTR